MAKSREKRPGSAADGSKSAAAGTAGARPTPVETRSPPEATHWTGIAFGAALAMLAAYQQFKLPPALPLLIDRFGYAAVAAGAMMSVYAVVGLALSLPLGRWVQRLGALPFIYAGLGCFTVGPLLGLVAPQVTAVMLTARLVEGIGFAILALIGHSLVTRSAGARHAGLAVGITATWIPAGQLVGSAIAVPALSVGLWQALWWAGLALTLAAGVWGTMLLRNGRLRLQDLGGAGSTGTAAAPGAAAALSHGERVALILGAAVFCLWSMQFFAYMTWLPTFLTERFALGSDVAVIAYAVPVAVLLVFNVATGWVLGRGVPVAGLLALGLLSQAAVWALLPVTGPGWGGGLSLVVYGIGAGICPTCLFAIPGAVLGRHRTGSRALAITLTGRNLGVLAGPLILAGLVGSGDGWALAGPILATTTVIALGLALVLHRRLHRRLHRGPT